MNVLVKSVKNEFYKLIKKKKYLVLLIISIAICAGRVGIGMLVERISQGMVNMNKISNLIMQMFPFFAEILVPLVVFMAVTDLFSNEILDGTMKAVLMRPITRFKVMTSKIFAAFSIGILYYMVIFAACVILELLVSNIKAGYVLQTLGAYLIDMIPLFITTLMAVVINLISKSPTLAMFLSIVVYALMKYCNYFIPALNAVLFTSYNQWHRLWIGATLPFSALAPKVGVILGSGIVLYTVGYLLFERKEY